MPGVAGALTGRYWASWMLQGALPSQTRVLLMSLRRRSRNPVYKQNVVAVRLLFISFVEASLQVNVRSLHSELSSWQAAEDVNVTFEDQQKINKFARNTSRITELKEEIEVKKKQLQNLEDACDDIMMLDDDDSLLIPYQIGDVFISHSQEETQEMLEEAKKSLQEEIEVLESRVESIQRVLSDLKVQLYAKFGNNINLEAEDS
ncbi:PREDICTED: prefoldin subunit 4 [Apaloderma vittatum]|nr:PREDICTED: prefoldin subunit 4 [Apaloderma vittatum]